MGRGERPIRQMGRGESTDSASLGQPICTEGSPCEFEAEEFQQGEERSYYEVGRKCVGLELSSGSKLNLVKVVWL